MVHEDVRQRAKTFVRAYDRDPRDRAAEPRGRLPAARDVRIGHRLRPRRAGRTRRRAGRCGGGHGQDVRKRDIARLVLQKAGGIMGGAELLIGGKVEPEPLAAPAGKARAPEPPRPATSSARRPALLDAISRRARGGASPTPSAARPLRRRLDDAARPRHDGDGLGRARSPSSSSTCFRCSTSPGSAIRG